MCKLDIGWGRRLDTQFDYASELKMRCPAAKECLIRLQSEGVTTNCGKALDQEYRCEFPSGEHIADIRLRLRNRDF
jgi:hypothetical protein